MKWLKQVMNLEEVKFHYLNNYAIYLLDDKIKWGRIPLELAEELRKLNGLTFQEVYTELKGKGFFGERELLALLKNISYTKEEREIYNYKDKTVFFIITKRCNLLCKTCYISSEKENDECEITLQQMEIAFERLSEAGYHSITLSGGEPFLRKDIKDILELAARYFKRISVNTNGTLITQETAKFLKDKNIFVMVSLEGAETNINDEIRGAGTFKKIIEAIQYFKDVGHQGISVSMTVTYLNHKNIIQVYELCSKFEIPVHMGIFIETGRGLCNSESLKMSPNQLVGSYVNLLEKELKSREPNYYIPSLLTKCATYCGAIYSILNIMPDGDVYPCPNLIDYQWKMGNIIENDIDYIIQNSPVTQKVIDRDVRKMHDCEKCAIKYICGGGCMANAYFENQDIYSRDPLCPFYKAIYTSYIENWEMDKTDVDNTREVIKSCRINL